MSSTATATCKGPFHHLIWERFLSARYLQGIGAYLVVLTLLLLVTVGTAAFRVQKTRRSVGILWDLASFWPRSTHPFAAPCYAERSVPDLTTRIFAYTQGTSPRPVIIAAHSQGTVLSAATLLQLNSRQMAGDAAAQQLPDIAFLTFGCVLRRLYTRYFPAYFSTTALKQVQSLLTAPEGRPRWINLWRHTDYLGGQVTAGPPPQDPLGQGQAPGGLDWGIEKKFIDPAWARPVGDTQYPAASRHSNYWFDPEFGQSVLTLAQML